MLCTVPERRHRRGSGASQGVQARATRACTPVVGLRGPGQPIFSALVAVELSTVVVDWNVARTWYEPFARTGSTTE